MTVRCPGCHLTVTIHVAPTFGQEPDVTDVMCIGCGLYFDATPGPNLGQVLPVCEGFEVPPAALQLLGRPRLHIVREEGS